MKYIVPIILAAAIMAGCDLCDKTQKVESSIDNSCIIGDKLQIKIEVKNTGNCIVIGCKVPLVVTLDNGEVINTSVQCRNISVKESKYPTCEVRAPAFFYDIKIDTNRITFENN